MQNQRALILLFAANTVSGLATGITILAIPWYFSHFLGRASLFGWSYALITFLTIFWGLYAGTLIDRYSRKLIFLFSTGVSSLVIGAIAFFGFMMGEVPPVLAILAFATTFFNFSVHYPNLYAFGQEITPRKHFGRINSYIEIQGQSTNAIAGALAAGVLSTSGGGGELSGILTGLMPFQLPRLRLEEILLLDAGTYFLSFLLITFIRYQSLSNRQPSRGTLKQRLTEGFGFLKSRPNLFLFGLASNAIFIVVLTHIFYLLAIYVNNNLDGKASTFGLAEMLFALGALTAGITIRWIHGRSGPLRGIMINTFIGMLMVAWLAITKQVWVLLIISLFLGLTNAGNRVLRMTYLFGQIPNDVIGRTNSVFNVIGTTKRIMFIGLFSLTFFSTSDHIIYSYFILSGFIGVSLAVMLLTYNKLPGQ